MRTRRRVSAPSLSIFVLLPAAVCATKRHVRQLVRLAGDKKPAHTYVHTQQLVAIVCTSYGLA
jgi:hypothetical protein